MLREEARERKTRRNGGLDMEEDRVGTPAVLCVGTTAPKRSKRRPSEACRAPYRWSVRPRSCMLSWLLLHVLLSLLFSPLTSSCLSPVRTPDARFPQASKGRRNSSLSSLSAHRSYRNRLSPSAALSSFVSRSPSSHSKAVFLPTNKTAPFGPLATTFHPSFLSSAFLSRALCFACAPQAVSVPSPSANCSGAVSASPSTAAALPRVFRSLSSRVFSLAYPSFLKEPYTCSASRLLRQRARERRVSLLESLASQARLLRLHAQAGKRRIPGLGTIQTDNANTREGSETKKSETTKQTGKAEKTNHTRDTTKDKGTGLRISTEKPGVFCEKAIEGAGNLGRRAAKASEEREGRDRLGGEGTEEDGKTTGKASAGARRANPRHRAATKRDARRAGQRQRSAAEITARSKTHTAARTRATARLKPEGKGGKDDIRRKARNAGGTVRNETHGIKGGWNSEEREARAGQKVHLVLVESPAKAQTIAKFLQEEEAIFVVRATRGHVRQLERRAGAVLVRDGDVSFAWQPIGGRASPSVSSAISAASRDAQKAPTDAGNAQGDSAAKTRKRRKGDLALRAETLEEEASFLLRSVKDVISEFRCIDTLFICTDPDREGEAIAWHIYASLKRQAEQTKLPADSPSPLPDAPPSVSSSISSASSLLSCIKAIRRVRLHELTPAAVRQTLSSREEGEDARQSGEDNNAKGAKEEGDEEAEEKKSTGIRQGATPSLEGLNENLVHAYLARLAIDFLAGFSLSPLLWRKLPGSKSAGRVQSAALKLLADREAAIEAFQPRSLASVHALVCLGRPSPGRSGRTDTYSGHEQTRDDRRDAGDEGEEAREEEGNEGEGEGNDEEGEGRGCSARAARKAGSSQGDNGPQQVAVHLKLTVFKGKPFAASPSPTTASSSFVASFEPASEASQAAPPQFVAEAEETAGEATGNSPREASCMQGGDSREAEAGETGQAERPESTAEVDVDRARDDNERQEDAENAGDAEAVLEELMRMRFDRLDLVVSSSDLKPPSPFRTATLQQAASRLLGFSPATTMRLAQALYEGVSDLGGLITYMRTDSSSLSSSTRADIRSFIASSFSPSLLGNEEEEEHGSEKQAKGARRKTRETPLFAQEAHEAIRPTNIELNPEALRRRLAAGLPPQQRPTAAPARDSAGAPDAGKQPPESEENEGEATINAKSESLSNAHVALYELIWRRTVASQMASARRQSLRISLVSGPPREASASNETAEAQSSSGRRRSKRGVHTETESDDGAKEDATRKERRRERPEGEGNSETRFEAEICRTVFNGFLDVYAFAPSARDRAERDSEDEDDEAEDEDAARSEPSLPSSTADVFSFFDAYSPVSSRLNLRGFRAPSRAAITVPLSPSLFCHSSSSTSSSSPSASPSPSSEASLASLPTPWSPTSPVVSSSLPSSLASAGLPFSSSLQFYVSRKCTRPPPRYSEASLINTLERLGIGRPSTYASVLASLSDRCYVYPTASAWKRAQHGVSASSLGLASAGSASASRSPVGTAARQAARPRRRSLLAPSPRGRLVAAFLEASVPSFVNANFTANLEEALDSVAAGSDDWVRVVHAVWEGLNAKIAEAEKTHPKAVRDALEQTLARMIFGEARDREETGATDGERNKEGEPKDRDEDGGEPRREDETQGSPEEGGHRDSEVTKPRAGTEGDGGNPSDSSNEGNAKREAPVARQSCLDSPMVVASLPSPSASSPSSTSSLSPSLSSSVTSSPSSSASAVSSFASPRCPSCAEGVLKLRIHSRGIFVGCSAYPKCTYTQQVPPPQKREKDETSLAAES
ncbi:putative toprim domain-containing protein [Neospora caninum Liverpool]|uniref:DNA topoisomerase n=1 Tax=Neospora caninum (strain Liverpool) TaxID=572307 RepID=F0VRR4_NEOCL|nr:putative toprim domain-containing protein [Neospora caninum Liverpool]CBZ56412.1 putative toprim domain-containing protein [Neospora caninum Liverpool]CEL71170.1 TPA: toprim domain-containing protein, putative [Neospora caninum Liverpool]|eukprot:XP_003886437.1 putative toprim domain-containing protein [Neospora caninum Liverpool]